MLERAAHGAVFRRLHTGMSAHADPAAIPQAPLDGFNRHYALFRDCARLAKRHFEAGNWLAIGHVARDRIDFYDRRCGETVERIDRDFGRDAISGSGVDELWSRVKLHFIGLLTEHRQPE